MGKIILVDDCIELHEPFLEVAQAMGHEAFAFADGYAAIKLLREGPVDLVISDVEMPGMHGFELNYWISRLYPRIPVVMWTGGDSQKAAEQTGRPCLQKGSLKLRDVLDKYLPKKQAA